MNENNTTGELIGRRVDVEGVGVGSVIAVNKDSESAVVQIGAARFVVIKMTDLIPVIRETVMDCGHGSRFAYCTLDQSRGCTQCNEIEAMKHDITLMENTLTRLSQWPTMNYVRVSLMAKEALNALRGGY